MGRAKLPLKLINDEKSRNITLTKRKKGLKKKASELAILCGVDVFVICFGPDGGRPETWPEKTPGILSIVERYVSISREEREKRNLDISGFLKQKTRSMQQELDQKRKQNAEIRFYPSWDDRLNDYPAEELWNLAGLLESKLEKVKQRISMVRSNEIFEEEREEVSEQAIQSYSLYLMGKESRKQPPFECFPLPFLPPCINFSSTRRIKETAEGKLMEFFQRANRTPHDYQPPTFSSLMEDSKQTNQSYSYYLPFSSEIDFGSVSVRGFDPHTGSENPCYPDNLSVSGPGFPASFSEINVNSILPPQSGFSREEDEEMGIHREAGLGFYEAGCWRSSSNLRSNAYGSSSSAGSNQLHGIEWEGSWKGFESGTSGFFPSL